MHLIFHQKNKRKHNTHKYISFFSCITKKVLSISLLLALLISNQTLIVRAELREEPGVGNQYIDVENGEWWMDTHGNDRKNAHASVHIERYKIDNENHTIQWRVVFNENREWWPRPTVGIILPKSDIEKTGLTRFIGDAMQDITPLNVVNDFNGGSHRWGYNSNEWKFNDEYYARIQKGYWNSYSGSNLNTWRDEGRFSRMLISNENGTGEPITWFFTTYHDEDTILENVPLVAMISNWGGAYQYVTAVGPFGIASFHPLYHPDPIYVDDINNLNDSDKQKIFAAVKKKVDQWIQSKIDASSADDPAVKTAIQEEEDATVELVDNHTYVKTFSDQSKLKMELSRFIIQREVSVDPQYNELLYNESANIQISVNDPGYSPGDVVVPVDGTLPDGLTWDTSTATIRGLPMIDWSQIQGLVGHKEKVFTFDVAMKKDDGTVNSLAATRKTVTIRVKQDETIIPVGVEDMKTTPFHLMVMLSLLAIFLVFINHRKSEN